MALPFVTDAQVKKAIKESVGGGVSPQPVGPVNDFEGLHDLLEDLMVSPQPEHGTIDKTFKFEYANVDERDLLGDALISQDYEGVRFLVNNGLKLLFALDYSVKPDDGDILISGRLNVVYGVEMDAETGDNYVVITYYYHDSILFHMNDLNVYGCKRPDFVSGTVRVIW